MDAKVGRRNRIVGLGLLVLTVTVLFVRLDGFTVRKVEGQLLEGAAAPLSTDIFPQLDQPYFYLAKGRQCFVFVSEDGATVLKFLNYGRFRFPRWISRHLSQKKERRFAATMGAFELADRYLRKETGLLYVHLRPSQTLPQLIILDGANRPHQIDLNRIAFVVQKRGRSFREEFLARDEQGVCAIIDALCEFLQKRCELQIADEERDVEKNFGFVNGELVYLDPGRIFLANHIQTITDLRITTKRFRRLLKQSHPTLIPYFDQRLNAISKYIPLPPEEPVFDCVGIATNFMPSLVPCARTMSLSPGKKFVQPPYQNSNF
jgi:hypothetical protein